MLVPHQSHPSPVHWPPRPPRLDHYFTQLPPDTATEPSLPADSADVNSRTDDATDRFYEDLAQDTDARPLEV